jgi:hypothetical protein
MFLQTGWKLYSASQTNLLLEAMQMELLFVQLVAVVSYHRQLEQVHLCKLKAKKVIYTLNSTGNHSKQMTFT